MRKLFVVECYYEYWTERGVQELVVAYFKKVPQHLPRGTEENHETPVRIGRLTDRESNSGPPQMRSQPLNCDSLFSTN
jgi:hypothetical protein